VSRLWKFYAGLVIGRRVMVAELIAKLRQVYPNGMISITINHYCYSVEPDVVDVKYWLGLTNEGIMEPHTAVSLLLRVEELVAAKTSMTADSIIKQGGFYKK